MSKRSPITEADLHAYVDHQLAPDRIKEVEAYLAHHAEAQSTVAAYLAQKASLHKAFDPILTEELPERLSIPHKPAKFGLWLPRVAAATAWVFIGAIGGWHLHPDKLNEPKSSDVFQTNLIKPAALAHNVYAVEVKHPVEVTAEHESHLAKWLSKRLNTPIRIPNLAAQGFTLVGGRLLPSTDRMAAQFMYDRADGMRVTLYQRRGNFVNQATSFRYVKDSNVGVFYWVDDKLAYALVGELDRKELLQLSSEVHRQLQ